MEGDELRQNKKILVVEDNPTNIILFQDVLESRGYTVSLAKTGYEAFEQVEKERPDVILMDIHLPGIDGLSVIKSIRSTPAYADIQIIGISAFAMESDIQAALEAGCNGYITKPISIRTFIEEVERFC